MNFGWGDVGEGAVCTTKDTHWKRATCGGHLWGAPYEASKKVILSFNSSRKIVLFQGAIFFSPNN